MKMLGHIRELRKTWVDNTFKYEVETPDGISLPFQEKYDLSNEHEDLTSDVRINLAKAGYKLFNLIFSPRDNGLKDIRRVLIKALRSECCVLHFDSQDLYAPWTMLYVPPGSDDDIRDPKFDWPLEGFLGYRHWIQHQLHDGDLETKLPLRAGNRMDVGLNVDTRIDIGKSEENKLVGPLEKFVQGLTSANPTKRSTKPDLEKAIAFGECDDHFMCFCCHAVVSDVGADPEMHHARMELSDGIEINTGDFETWLSSRQLPNSVVFVDACQGGQMESMFYRSFGRTMLQNGANCLIGPQLDLPTSFAYQYTTRFLEKFIVPQTCIGDITRELAREFADRHSNPLGLMFTIYRGLDTRCVEGADGYEK
ncbi:hypothetical protein [Streptomyces sp. NPDC020681]|uniref:hypothetical protein n=1 Tax=Streptomyces sp. NPDC020681 TaxID=3365083 RepID=UPI0037982A3D